MFNSFNPMHCCCRHWE